MAQPVFPLLGLGVDVARKGGVNRRANLPLWTRQDLL